MPEPIFSNRRERRFWLYSGMALLAIYSTIGFTPVISGFLRANGLLGPVFVACLLLIVGAVVAAGVRAKLGGREIAVLLGIGAVYALVLVRMELPEERTHLLEYGVVALFVYEALAERAKRKTGLRHVPLWAIALAACAGAIDECLQLALPQRVFDLRDILFNTLAATMAVGAKCAFEWARRRGGKAPE